MLTRKQIADEIGRMTYKPGWKIEYHPGHDSGLRFDTYDFGEEDRLRIVMSVLDSQGSNEMVEVYLTQHLPYVIPDVRVLRHLVSSTLATMEMHEMQEWFRIDGELHDDPHASSKSARRES